MKNTFKWFVVIAIAAVIGFSMAGCGDDAGGQGGGGAGGGGGGGITVTGIPSEYNGYYATFNNASSNPGTITVPIFGAQSFAAPTITFPRISGGSVTMGLWTQDGQTYTKWNGSGTTTIGVFIRTVANSTTLGNKNVAQKIFYSVTITNGSATIAWSQGITPP
jgi:hypothetical protein